jgi:hypothetical protein
MRDDDGGGASRTTEAASGSSSGTDVSLREFLSSRIDHMDRHLVTEISALRKELETSNINSERAVKVASDEAKERLASHNGLIEQMREQAGHFVTREAFDDFKKAMDDRMRRTERFENMIAGGVAVIGAIGVANLVKIWGTN